LEVLGTPKRLDNYVVHLSQWGVTGITGTRDAAQRETALETRGVDFKLSALNARGEVLITFGLPSEWVC